MHSSGYSKTLVKYMNKEKINIHTGPINVAFAGQLPLLLASPFSLIRKSTIIK
jgi:hypothetical protein